MSAVNDITEQVLNDIKLCQMLETGDRVIVAVSGGADSVCLLKVLDKLKEELGISLFAVHIHHGLRGEEADRDADWVREFCNSMNIECSVVHYNVKEYAGQHGLSVEEAGRLLRYETFEREAKEKGAARIAVAHHGDDNAETILHNLFRGSGLRGLGGIPPVRGKIVRPLLSVGRSEILEYLRKENQTFCEDSTNSCNEYTRNKLRNQILPLIVEEINQGAVSNILHAGGLIAQADSYLEKTAKTYLEQYGKREEGGVSMSVAVLEQQESIIQAYLIRLMIKEICGSGKDITKKHIEQVQELIKKPVGRRLDLPYALTARRTYEELWIGVQNIRPNVDKLSAEELPVPVFTVFPYKKGAEIPQNEYTKWFDYDKIKSTLSVRTRRPGDYFTLSRGGHKSIKSYMIDEKIARENRDRIPLLAEENHVIWMIGYRISEYYKVTDQTQTILQVQVDGGNDDVR